MDELHMLDDDIRGYVLELMTTKLLSLEQPIQLIGLSATLNVGQLVEVWLKLNIFRMPSSLQSGSMPNFIFLDIDQYLLKSIWCLTMRSTQLQHQRVSTTPQRS